MVGLFTHELLMSLRCKIKLADTIVVDMAAPRRQWSESHTFIQLVYCTEEMNKQKLNYNLL